MYEEVLSVGLLAHRGRPFPNFLGSCFLYHDDCHFLTAAHCVGQLDGDEVEVKLSQPGPPPAVRVHNIIRHDRADIAILETECASPLLPFQSFQTVEPFGDDFVAFGYPADIFGEQPSWPTPRLFKGHFQRTYRHESYLGFKYSAAELSIPAPAGLSGGPVFWPGSMFGLVGLVTENLESTTTLDAVDEVQESGLHYRETHRKVITYGVALLLEDVANWLKATLPARRGGA